MFVEYQFPRPPCFLMPLLCFGILSVGFAAHAQAATEKTVAEILREFESKWNANNWSPRYMRATSDEGWKHRTWALHRIVQLGKTGTSDLLKALSSKNENVRALAAQSIGYCGDPTAIPALRKTLSEDSTAMVRLYAADSIGMLGDSDSNSQLKEHSKSERNRDTKRHIEYVLDRNGSSIGQEVSGSLVRWDASTIDSAQLNKMAPDFELNSVDGTKVRLSQFRGKKTVVLVFVYGDT